MIKLVHNTVIYSIPIKWELEDLIGWHHNEIIIFHIRYEVERIEELLKFIEEHYGETNEVIIVYNHQTELKNTGE